MNAPQNMALMALTGKLAKRFDMGDGRDIIDILKNTAFKVKDGTVSDNQMAALLVIANQYGLNPFTKEIYAYPDKSNGIVPVVGVDGWSRIINEHPQLDGIEFRYSEATTTHKGKTAHEWIECVITRKDRAAPIVVREYFDEVVRSMNFATPWDSHPKRMHRHKALIQCSRVSFGFAGIYDPDEAERIVEGTEAIGGAASGTVIDGATGEVTEKKKPELPAYPAEAFAKVLAKWRESGTKSPEDFAAMLATKGVLSAEQKSEIAKGRNVARAEPKPAASAGNGITYAQVAEQINKASDMDLLDAAADLIGEVADQTQRAELNELYNERQAALGE